MHRVDVMRISEPDGGGPSAARSSSPPRPTFADVVWAPARIVSELRCGGGEGAGLGSRLLRRVMWMSGEFGWMRAVLGGRSLGLHAGKEEME